MRKKEDDYVVVTVYTHPNGTRITHAYGYYTKEQAARKRLNLLEEFFGQDIVVTANKVLRVDEPT